VADRVHFLGLRGDVERIQAAGEALIQPSLQDPFPNACLEALASGLPVIASRVTGPSEILVEGKNGFVIDHASRVDQLAAGLRALDDPARREAMGLEARKTAEGFSLEKYVNDYLKLYEEIAASRR
jgi:UDP-glucose:(heptosyl)LPS alpha-1,3-glucosyltransferase